MSVFSFLVKSHKENIQMMCFKVIVIAFGYFKASLMRLSVDQMFLFVGSHRLCVCNACSFDGESQTSLLMVMLNTDMTARQIRSKLFQVSVCGATSNASWHKHVPVCRTARINPKSILMLVGHFLC